VDKKIPIKNLFLKTFFMVSLKNIQDRISGVTDHVV
jgi:hypothetical protein